MPYQYANNTPLNQTDPSGLFSVGDALGAVGNVLTGLANTAICQASGIFDFAANHPWIALTLAAGLIAVPALLPLLLPEAEGAAAVSGELAAAEDAAVAGEEVAAESADDGVSIYKASQPGLTAQHLAEGYKPEDFPGSAFFTRDKAVAEHWGQIYGEGHIETRIPGSVFDEHLAQHEYPYPGWPGMTELEVPSSLLDLISSFPRTLH